MKKMFSFVNLLICFLVAVIFGETLFYQKAMSQEQFILTPLTQYSPIAGKVLGQTAKEEGGVKTPVTLLIIGVDARVGDKNPRCDAIHFIRFDLKKELIRITTIPRGTRVLGEEDESGYIGNMCHRKGIESAIALMEKISGETADYVIKIGFSQTLGILRSFHIPASSTLQFLRNRQYAIGDYQRSRNQAVFLKDGILNYTEIAAHLPNTVKYLLFRTIDTNLDFETAMQIVDQLAGSAIPKDSSRIQLITKPSLPLGIREVHFSNSKEEKDEDFIIYQNNLTTQLKNRITQAEILLKNGNKEGSYRTVETLFNQKLWLQIEDEKTRNQIHFDLLQLFVKTSPPHTSLSSLILDFITEMEEIGENEKGKEGKELLSSL